MAGMTGNRKPLDKAPMGLLPLDLLEVVARAFGHGARKYGPENWRDPLPGLTSARTADEYRGAALRHLSALQGGVRLDDESGLPHWAHAVASLLIMAWHDERREG